MKLSVERRLIITGNSKFTNDKVSGLLCEYVLLSVIIVALKAEIQMIQLTWKKTHKQNGLAKTVFGLQAGRNGFPNHLSLVDLRACFSLQTDCSLQLSSFQYSQAACILFFSGSFYCGVTQWICEISEAFVVFKLRKQILFLLCTFLLYYPNLSLTFPKWSHCVYVCKCVCVIVIDIEGESTDSCWEDHVIHVYPFPFKILARYWQIAVGMEGTVTPESSVICSFAQASQ